MDIDKIEGLYIVSKVKEVKYMWTNIDSSSVDFNSATTAAVVQTATKDTIDISLVKTNSTGAWQLHIKLIDYAGNEVIYTYSKEFVIDDIDLEVIDISVINPNDDVVYNAGEKLTFVVSFNKAVTLIDGKTNALPTLTIGGSAPKNTFRYTVFATDFSWRKQQLYDYIKIFFLHIVLLLLLTTLTIHPI